ncbi:hypothetical protein OEA41_002964 [Lepraria neglecta]|uniref:Uncharacterized protein n=1 Tax=Lepraria neglecta TaxID=209136 RepID=A0AAD9Z3X8_9LECA|nr:hypothetical protein OEA41_002964 [Lepraria neglecta]
MALHQKGKHYPQILLPQTVIPSQRRPASEFAGQATEVAEISSRIPQPVMTSSGMTSSGMTKRRTHTRMMMKRNQMVIISRTRRLYCTKKRSLCTAGEKPQVKCRIECGRFSSWLSSDEETETGDESDSSSYTPSELHHVSTPRPNSSRSTGVEGDTSSDGKMKLTDGQSQMVVAYKQQSWKGEIIEERNIQQGRGRPYKEYPVR